MGVPQTPLLGVLKKQVLQNAKVSHKGHPFHHCFCSSQRFQLPLNSFNAEMFFFQLFLRIQAFNPWYFFMHLDFFFFMW